ncbi:S-layer homology domain-containing protein [Paenibacillus contaminans]|uniref:SLH domain-containing protein n=1 Tax=Paenibacillus contaminans TaxID=450362 RepID=A0A329MIN4_9BACL|nr:S-layer homology domain-containing protein [Paenibacillus contaminans]RAV19664.1 hypothetical protein DQG23_19585 [Paenibacillus contaminans]
MIVRGKARLALLLSFCLLFQLLFVIQAKPAAAESPINLIENPGFEDTTDHIPAHWLVIGDVWNDGIRASAAAARSGNYGVAIETNIANNPWVAFPVPVEEGATYEITSWFKTIGVSGDVGYKVEFFKGIDRTDANWIYGYPYYAESSLNEPIFRKLVYEIEAPAEAKYMYVYLRLYGTGTVYFDDVSVIKSKSKPQIIVDSEHRYYYSDIADGNVDLKIAPEDGMLANKTVDIRIVNEQSDAVLFMDSGVPAAETVSIPFDTSNMILQQPYRIEAELKDGQSQLIESAEQTIYRWARPTTLPDNGRILVDGQPFFPVVAYHAGPEDYPYLQAIGVNTVQGTNTTDADTLESELNAAHANGLKMLVTLYNGMTVKENAQMTEKFVTRFKDHPAVLGYMVMDEPSTNGIPNSDLIDAYKLIRSIDPAHPTYMVEEDWKAYRYTGHATDILVTDVYPIREGSAALPLHSVGEHVRKAVASVGDSKPVWTVLQTFKYSNSFFTTLPTEDQLRNMAYQAILSGAKGLAFYALYDPGWDLLHSDFYPIMVKFKTELAFIRSLVIEGTQSDAYLDNDNNVQWAMYSKGDEQYAIAINMTQEAQTATIPLAHAGNDVELLYGDSHEQAGSWTQQLAVNLKPEQTLVYRIKPFAAGANQASGKLSGAQTLIADSEWQNDVQGLIVQLQQLKSALQAQSVNAGGAMNLAASTLGDIADLKDWVSGKSDQQLEGKREELNAVLDQAAADLMPIMQAAAKFDLQLSAAPQLAGDELELNVGIHNAGNQEMESVQLRIELPAEMDLSSIEQTIGNIQSGNSADRQLDAALPDDMQPGVYAVKAVIDFLYEGIHIRIPVERSFTVQPLLTAKLTPNYIDITGAGAYTFSVELQNGSGQPLDVDLQAQTVSGITVNLASAVTLAGNEKRTVQGSMTIPANMTQGEYTVTIEALSAGVSYATLPLHVYANTNAVFNGGFERKAATATTPEGWDKWAGEWDKSVARSGAASIKLNPNAADPWNVANTDQNHLIPISPGFRYKLTGWVKTAATAGEVALGIRQIDAAGDSILYNWERAEKTGDWEKIEVFFEAEPAAKHAAVYFKIDQNVNAPAWVDDLELSRITEPINPVFNPGFEKKAGAENRPDGWQLYNGTWDSTVAHGGTYSARLNPDANDPFNVINMDEPKAIQVEAGREYVLTGWVKNSATVGSAALGIREVNADGESIRYTWAESAPNSDWTKLNVLFTAQPETRTVWVYFKMDQAADGPAWLDDLELSEVVTALEADMSASSIDADHTGTYPFAVELTNGSNIPVKVDLLRDVPNGLTVTLDENITLAAGETKTVQGTVSVSVYTADDAYNVTIEAKVGDVSYATLPLAVNVRIRLAERIEISGLTSPMTVGAKANTVVTAVYNHGSPVDVTASAQFNSSNTSVATVSATGEVTAASAGSTVISATYGEHTASFNLTVTALPDTNQPNTSLPYIIQNTETPIDKPAPETKTDVMTIGQEQVKADKDGKVTVALPEGKKSLAIPVEIMKLLAETGLTVAGDAASISIPKETFQTYLPHLGGGGSLSFRFDRLLEAAATELLGKIDKPGNLQLQSAGDMIDVGASLVDKDGKKAAAAVQGQLMTIKLPLTPGVDPRLAGIYLIHDDGQLVFIGGKRNGDTMEAEISDFGNYALLAYDKHYNDVNASYWAADTIRVLSARHIVNGNTETDFAPQKDITRAEFAALLVRALNLKRRSTSANFVDVAETQWFAGEVATAKEAGLVYGKDDGKFAPDQPITREEMAVMLVRAWELLSGSRKQAGNTEPIGDVGQASVWAQEPIRYALEQGLLNGRGDGRFDPMGSTSRAESAQAIFNLLGLQNKL